MSNPPSGRAQPDTVRDRLWLFACPANTDFGRLQLRSLMTPLEGAYYMGLPNLIVVNSGGDEIQYGRFEPPFEQYALALRPLKRIVWSIVGSGGETSDGERQLVLRMAKETPNFTGVFMDDFFRRDPEQPASLSLDELKALREQLTTEDKRLDLMVTFYVSFLDEAGGKLDEPRKEYLDLIDVISFWTGDPKQIRNLEANMEKLEAIAPKSRKLLGCYWVDYGRRGGIPVADMQHQCELGLRWLREGRIEGIVFLGNTSEDLGFESVEWTRGWIGEVRDERL